MQKETQPFATLESAVAFMHLLAGEIGETRTDVQQDIADAESGPDLRRVQALQLVDYKLHQLALHVAKSERLLRDLGRLRTLIMEGSNVRAAASSER